MGTTKKTSISVSEIAFNQVESLAQHLNMSTSHLLEMAIEDFVRNHPGQPQRDTVVKTHADQPAPDDQSHVSGSPANTAPDMREKQAVINQGDIYWVQLDDPSGSEPGIPHPHVVIQEDVINHSRIDTAVVCALTSRLSQANLPGNVLLDANEANLPRQSVVEVSKVSTIHKTQLNVYIGSLSEQRLNQIMAGMRFLQRSFSVRYTG